MSISKLAIASEYLTRAIELYFRGNSYCSALHLAGAAQELLGKFVERSGGVSAHTSLAQGAARISGFLDPHGVPSTEREMKDIINRAKNRVKHMNAAGDDVIEFDPQTHAREMLDLAVSEFYQLWGDGAELEMSDEIERYNRYQVERC